ncbi:MAG: AIR synthase family protein [Clostridia bacterium]|nr:AIR synthase family protein [Clostridia bacterium]
MKPGKLSNDDLKKILSGLSKKRDDILIGPAVGEDCGVVDFGQKVCVVSSDPITGAEKGVGFLAVNVSCNDVASCGVEPVAMLVTMMVPVTATLEMIQDIMMDINDAATALDVDIIGGHTEVTDVVNKVVIVSTVLGKGNKQNLITSSGAKPGDYVIMTKTAGIEGTSIIASDFYRGLSSHIDIDVLDSAIKFRDRISVVKEGIICGKENVSAMHDITEGGVYGAAWEIAEASGVGIELWKDDIKIARETEILCDFLNVDPYRLISSGSMLITAADCTRIISILKMNGIECNVIGKILDSSKRIKTGDGEYLELMPPDKDEIYKVEGKVKKLVKC